MSKIIIMISFAIVMMFTLVPSQSHAWIFQWPGQTKSDFEKTNGRAQAMYKKLLEERALYDDFDKNDRTEFKHKKYMALSVEIAKYGEIVESYKVANKNTTLNYYFNVAVNTVSWTVQDLTAVVSDMMNRWPDIMAKSIENGWTEVIKEAYDSTFRIKIRKKIKETLGFASCKKIEDELLKMVAPSDSRSQMVQRAEKYSQDAMLGAAKDKYAKHIKRRAAKNMQQKLKGMSKKTIKEMTKTTAKKSFQAAASAASSAVDAASLFGDIFQKVFIYNEFVGTLERELSAMNNMVESCKKYKKVLTCNEILPAMKPGAKCLLDELPVDTDKAISDTANAESVAAKMSNEAQKEIEEVLARGKQKDKQKRDELQQLADKHGGQWGQYSDGEPEDHTSKTASESEPQRSGHWTYSKSIVQKAQVGFSDWKYSSDGRDKLIVQLSQTSATYKSIGQSRNGETYVDACISNCEVSWSYPSVITPGKPIGFKGKIGAGGCDKSLATNCCTCSLVVYFFPVFNPSNQSHPNGLYVDLGSGTWSFKNTNVQAGFAGEGGQSPFAGIAVETPSGKVFHIYKWTSGN